MLFLNVIQLLDQVHQVGERVQISANRKVLMIVINFIANFGESNYYRTCSKDCGNAHVI